MDYVKAAEAAYKALIGSAYDVSEVTKDALWLETVAYIEIHGEKTGAMNKALRAAVNRVWRDNH